MNTLIIYDSIGYVITQMSGSVREPQGIPFIWSVIPEGKRLVTGVGVNVSVTPNIAILEDIPLTDIQQLENENATMLMALVTGGLM